jgi:hypothetical protein
VEVVDLVLLLLFNTTRMCSRGRTPKHGGFDVVKSSRRRFEGARGGGHGGWGDEQLRACSLAPGGELAKLSCPSERVFSTCVDS